MKSKSSCSAHSKGCLNVYQVVTCVLIPECIFSNSSQPSRCPPPHCHGLPRRPSGKRVEDPGADTGEEAELNF